jgi:hypothetical protein
MPDRPPLGANLFIVTDKLGSLKKLATFQHPKTQHTVFSKEK